MIQFGRIDTSKPDANAVDLDGISIDHPARTT
jgi:hypothetical protein